MVAQRQFPDEMDAATRESLATRSTAIRVREIIGLIGGAALMTLLLALVWYAGRILLLTLGGVILAVFLTGLARTLSKYTRLRYGWSLAIVIGVLLALFALACWLLGSRISQQADELSTRLPQAFQGLEDRLQHYRWGRMVLARFQSADQQPLGEHALSSAGNVLSAAGDVVMETLLVLLVGLYGAVSPKLYIAGMMRLFPTTYRPRVRQAMEAASYTLWWWVICRLVSMAWVAVASTVALWLLGIPLPLALGIIAGLCRFVPYIGPWVGAIPAVLFALIQGPTSALYVAIVYVVIEMIDDYVILPLLQWRSMWLPPALAIAAQVLLGTIWGVVGVLFAMPLAAVVMVFVQVLYVEGTLGEPVQVVGQSNRESQPAGSTG